MLAKWISDFRETVWGLFNHSNHTGLGVSYDPVAKQIRLSAPLPKQVLLGSDATAITGTSLTDVPGLSFALLSGVPYYFEFHLLYDIDASSNGLKLSINGPAFTVLSYDTEVPTSSSARLNLNSTSLYNQSSAPTSSPSATANTAFVRGFVKPSATGTLQVRVAVSKTSQNLTIRAGSFGSLTTLSTS